MNKKALKIICILLFGGVFMFILCGIIFPNMALPTKEIVQKQFETHENEFSVIVSYLRNVGYDSVYISDNNGKMSVSINGEKVVGQQVLIDNQEVLNSLGSLFAEYDSMIVSSNAESVEFQTWSTRYSGCGIVYSYSGKVPQIEFMTALEPLSKIRWYYFVSDYNEYR